MKINRKRSMVIICITWMVISMSLSGWFTRVSDAATGTITRGQWIHNLVTAFDMALDETSLPDNYYSDIKEGETYYDDIMLATGYGVINLEAGKNFESDQAVTREFAAHTLNFCLGYQLDEASEYTFSDKEDCIYPEDDQIALNRGWINLSNGKFIPQQPLTEEESVFMMNDAREILGDSVINTEYENVWNVKPGVIEVPKDIDIAVDADVITIQNCPVTISNNDIFVVYLGEIAVPYRAVSVSVAGTSMVIQTDEVEYEEAFTDIAAQGVIDSDSLIFEPAEGVELTDLEDDSTVIDSRIVKKVKDKKFKKDFKLSNGVTVTVEGTIKNIRVEFQAFSAKNTALAKVSCDISITDQIKVVPSSFGNASFELLNVGIPGLGGLTVNAEIKAAGTMNATVNQHVEIGISCSKSEGIRAIRSFKENGGSNSTISAEASMGVRARLGITGLKVLSGYVYADAGITGKFIDTVYTDGKTPVNCRTFLAYLYADYGASAGCSFLNYEYKDNVEIFNLQNSPVRVYHHYEDGSEVSKCARGETLEYFTKYYSKYFGTGWSKGYGAYGYDDAGEPYQIYEYSLSENDKGEKVATITKYHGNVTNLVIPDELDGYEVVGIGRDAFSGNAYMMGVTIPDSVVKIQSGAFLGCSRLAVVKLSQNVEEIGGYAFGDCDSLTSIEIPKSLKSTTKEYYGKYLYGYHWGIFIACDNLRTITFEKGVTKIPEGIFANNDSVESVSIPDTVTKIGEASFYKCSALADIKISDNVTEIGREAFSNDKLLTTVTIPDSVEKIGPASFLGCSKLSTVRLSKSVEEMGGYAFGDCDSLTSIEIPKSLKSTTKEYYGEYIYNFQWGVFIACDNLKTITFENGTTKIPEGIFANNDSIESISIPDTVTKIGEASFYKCSALADIRISDNVTEIGREAFSNDKLLTTVTIPDSVKKIGPASFLGCSKLATVKLSENVEEIGGYAFGDCDSLESIEIPKSLKNTTREYYGEYIYNFQWGVFIACDNLKTITFEEGRAKIPEGLFANNDSIETIKLPDTVTQIESNAFYKCSALKTIDCSHVKEMGDNAFSGCSSLVSVKLCKEQKNIMPNTFSNCSSLTEINLPEKLQTIRNSAFADCSSLEQMIIPEFVTIIEDNSFSDCTSLKQVIISDAVLSLGKSSFANCKTLTDFSFSEGLISIGSYAFENCISLEKISLPDTLQTLGKYVFQKCETLSNIKLGAGVKDIPEYTFFEDPAIENIILPQQVTSIGAYTFGNCTGLKNITINRNVNSITANAFSYPSKLTIYGVDGTYVENFANENNITFISLNVPAQDLKLGKTECQLSRGNTLQLTASITPEDSSDELTWISGDESIVTVDKTGLIKGIKTGTTNVVAMIGNIIKVCEVTVYEPVTRVSLNTAAKDMSLNETFQLEASISPSSASNQNVTWSSGDESIATVDQTGLVRAIAFGTTEITVTTEDQNKTAVCKITVKPIAVTGVTLNKQSLTMKEGTTYQLMATITPENAANQKIEWSSSDPTVVSVENGLLTAVKKGTVVIAVKTEDGGKTAICNVTVSDEEDLKPTSTPDVDNGSSSSENTDNNKDNNDNSDKVSSDEKNNSYEDDSKDVTNVTNTTNTEDQKVSAPAKVKIKSAKNKKAKKILVKWKKLKGVKGYQIQYSKNNTFKGKKSKNTKNTSITLKGLVKKKAYYIRIRAYKMDGSKKVYGKWSVAKKVKIKV